MTWRSSANLLYSNWLNYFVYQSTPYNIEQITMDENWTMISKRGDTVTAKFGGSSLANANCFKKVKEIIEADKRRRYVVVSAPGRRFKSDAKITDLLLEVYEAASSGDDAGELIREVERRFAEICEGLGMDFVLQQEILALKDKIEFGDADKDYVITRGEYFSAKIMSAYLGWELINPEEYIKFDAEGNLMAGESHKMLSEKLKTTQTAVIPGFYGGTYSNKIVAFSRGGSDVTGAIVAAASGSDLYENWTDVPGILMADPSIVNNPVTLPVITYKEIREMAYMGAEVMHQSAIKPVRELGIPINIKNTKQPEEPGTLIVKNADYYRSGDLVTGITGKTNLMSILIEKENLNEDPHLRGEVIHRLLMHGISIEHSLAEIDSLTIIVDKSQLRGISDVKSFVGSSLGSYIKDTKISVDNDFAIIAVIGRNLATTPDIAVRVLNSLSMRRINVKLIDHGPRRYNILIGVSEDNYAEAINSIYNNFVGHVV